MKTDDATIGSSFVVPDGSIEALKWAALALMTLDHINKYLLKDQWITAFELGRVVMPLFAFVLAYNLARPGALAGGVHFRVMKRLALYGVLATPFFLSLGGLVFGWWPLNIMFMLLLATAILYFVEKGAVALATALFLLGGAFVEFWWFGLALTIAAWWYCKSSRKTALFSWTLAVASLYVVNQNLWALASMPVIFIAAQLNVVAQLPRFPKIFYGYYPAHLAFLLLLSA